MRIKTTKRSIKESFEKVYAVGYCRLQFLLKYSEPFAYSTRREGWACDYYRVGDVVISTGYDPIGKRIDYSLIREYEDMARAMVTNYEKEHQEKEHLLEQLKQELIKELEG